MSWQKAIIGTAVFTTCFLVVWGAKIALKSALLMWAANL